MTGRAIELRVGGQSYRVVSSASKGDLERFAAAVDEKLAPYMRPGRPLNPNALLLAAMSLAHELETERDRASKIAERARAVVSRVSSIVDGALATRGPSADTANGIPRG